MCGCFIFLYFIDFVGVSVCFNEIFVGGEEMGRARALCVDAELWCHWNKLPNSRTT